jgi:hypothetical protein
METYIAYGTDGLPCLGFRPPLQPCQPQGYDLMQFLKDASLVLGLVLTIRSLME